MIRTYTKSDSDVVCGLLASEGFTPSQMVYDKFETWVMEKGDGLAGFFTVKQEYGKPYLQHFCVREEFRDSMVARRMIAFLKALLRGRGFRRLIVNYPAHKERLGRLVETYFKSTPYAENDGHKFILTEI